VINKIILGHESPSAQSKAAYSRRVGRNKTNGNAQPKIKDK